MMNVTQISEDQVQENPVINQMAQMGHEQILFCQDQASGLKAIIAVHNTTCGPALGGTRMWAYNNELEALNDVLRLSRGMTYKNAISGLNLGGGKAVIIGNSKTDKSEALFRRFGQFVDSLAGKYITAEDVGISPKDMDYVNMETNHVVGLEGKSGDPSPVTAYGVYVGMKACVKHQTGSDSLGGKKVLVQGVGHVGEYLVKHLHEEGAQIMISDIDEETLRRVSENYGAEIIGINDVYSADMDIYAPCALGATVNDDTIGQLKASIICGAANNQLRDENVHGKKLTEMGLIYAPDFMVNAGGVINCYSEVAGLTSEWAMSKAQDIYNTTTEILKRSSAENVPSYQIANKMAEERVEAMGKLKLSHR